MIKEAYQKLLKSTYLLLGGSDVFYVVFNREEHVGEFFQGVFDTREAAEDHITTIKMLAILEYKCSRAQLQAIGAWQDCNERNPLAGIDLRVEEHRPETASAGLWKRFATLVNDHREVMKLP